MLGNTEEIRRKKPNQNTKKECHVLISAHSSDVFISYGGDQKRVKGRPVGIVSRHTSALLLAR